MRRRLAIAAWLGFALSALFFYSLAVALDGEVYYLQWQAEDLAETVVAFALLAIAYAGAIFALWPRTGRGALLALAAVALLPLASLAAGLVRQLPFDDTLRALAEHRSIRWGIPVAGVTLLAAAVVFWPRGLLRGIRILLVLVSPVSLVVVEILISSAFQPHPIVGRSTEGSGTETGEGGCTPVLALLFDELSFSYLYADGVVRPELSEIGGTAAQATNYLSVAAPNRETLVSMPSFLAARYLRDIRVDGTRLLETGDDGRSVPFTASGPEALFPTARALGFSTEMAGYYLPYCALLDGLLDACQSLSFYNMSGVTPGFSPEAPLLTTLLLWPRQFPFGLLKNPPFARLQRGLVEQTTAFAMRPMRAARPVFRLVHFSVPHLPFVFDAEGFSPPFDPLRTSPDTAYARQVRYVDTLFGTLMQRLRNDGTYDTTTVVVLADHGFRFGGAERSPLHIPFIVKKAGQGVREDVVRPMRGEVLLKQVIEDACRPG